MKNLAAEGRAPVVGDARFVAATYDGTVIKVYVNGQHVGTDSSSTDASVPASAANVYVGRRALSGRRATRMG